MQKHNEFNKVKDKRDTIFLNSRNIKTSDPHRLLLKIIFKIK